MKKKHKPTETTEAQTQTAEVTATKKSPVIFIVSVIAVMIGIAAIILGIVLPLALSDEFIKEEGVNPYAEIKLSNGMTLNYEIWETDCENAATNFIYLAEIGYFDGTVIFDTHGGYVRFGGWQENSEHRGDSNTDFLNKLPKMEWNNSDYSNNKFGYRLRRDSKHDKDKNTVGVLSFCYARSATEFQIVASETTTPKIEGDNAYGDGWESAPFGMAADDKTIENVKAIAALSRDEAGEKFKHEYFRAPLDKDGLIKIKSVKVRKKLESKWRTFDFMDFYRGEKTSSRLSSWGTSKKKTGSK